MKLSFETIINAEVNIIWSYYTKPSLWKEWDENIEYFIIDGEIKTGASGKLKMKGDTEVELYFDEVVKENKFVNSAAIAPLGGKLVFEHIIVKAADKVKVLHSVELIKDDGLYNMKELSILKSVFAGIPDNVMKLRCLCEKR